MATNVKPIPEGFHTLTPGIIVKDGARAIDFYKKAFGAEERFRMTGPDGKSIVHAELRIGDSILMLGEENLAWGARSPQSLSGTPCSLHLYVEDADAAFKRAVDAGAHVKMPVENAFWGDRYGKLVDPFGHEWSVATHKEDLTPEEISQRGQEWMAKMMKPGQ
ncbi:MAG: VOC family protein [Planctomycetes bacterium]|nr:VOC family protein [Planctomycetota bacterium]